MLGWLFGRSPRPVPPSDAHAQLAQAYAHHQAGRLAEARAGYETLLAADPAHFDAVHMLAVLALQSGRAQEAVELARRAVQAQPADANAHNTLGEACRAAGGHADAESAYRRAIALNPSVFGAHVNLGHLLRRLGRNAEALDCYATSVALRPELPDAHVHLGEALTALGRFEDAAAEFRSALERNADWAPAHAGLGNALLAQGNADQALAACQRALALRPDLAVMHFNAANALRVKGFVAEAISAYQAAIEREPELAPAHNNLGNLLRDQNRLDEALACFERALTIDPELAEAWINVGGVLMRQMRPADAAEVFRSALARQPGFAEAHYELGNALMRLGEQAQALSCYRKALAHDPELVTARWALAMSQLPAVAGKQEQLERGREAFGIELGELERWCAMRGAQKAARAVGVQQPYYLAYQEGDHRELLARYGRLCTSLMAGWQGASGLALPARITRAEMRIGIVSAHVHDHSVWNAIVKGWLSKLDRARYDLRLFHLGTANDAETAYAKTMVTHFSYGRTDWREWAPLILGHQLDVLIYPEIGMDPTTAKLASMRLAPVQAAAWGHPMTSGLPTIDHFLSAADLEPPEGAQHYTEKLVRLPGLGVCCDPAAVAPLEMNPAALGIRDGVPLLLCAGTPYKYAPRHDGVLVEIARRLGECQLVFFETQPREMSALLRERLEHSFGQAGLKFAQFGLFVPWQSGARFRGLLAQADVLLDTIGFSGFNTALQAIGAGLPIAAWEGRYLRGRLASGILRRMGLDELVADTPQAYADIAVRLAQDAAWWGRVRERILAARAKLYGDTEPVRALERFFEQAVS